MFSFFQDLRFGSGMLAKHRRAARLDPLRALRCE
jgi:hypothetical protein